MNANINANANLNANVNVNANTNLNANVNANANVNTNNNANVNAATLDSDSDGLTDEREELYGTDKNDADTDNDNFMDGAEIENLYSPNGTGRLSLTDYKTFCQNTFLAAENQPYDTTELTTMCNNMAEVYEPILTDLIAGNISTAQDKIGAVQDSVQTKCNTQFFIDMEKNLGCVFTGTLLMSDFGNT